LEFSGVTSSKKAGIFFSGATSSKQAAILRGNQQQTGWNSQGQPAANRLEFSGATSSKKGCNSQVTCSKKGWNYQKIKKKKVVSFATF
jgi:hypothetical protein